MFKRCETLLFSCEKKKLCVRIKKKLFVDVNIDRLKEKIRLELFLSNENSLTYLQFGAHILTER